MILYTWILYNHMLMSMGNESRCQRIISTNFRSNNDTNEINNTSELTGKPLVSCLCFPAESATGMERLIPSGKRTYCTFCICSSISCKVFCIASAKYIAMLQVANQVDMYKYMLQAQADKQACKVQPLQAAPQHPCICQ